jgi:hypothetical protein
MPRPCGICTHPQRHAIDQALTAGEAFRNMAPRFGTSATALHRHKHEHLLGPLAHVQQPQHTSGVPQDPQSLRPDSPAPVQALPSPLSCEAHQALAAYQIAVHEYETRRTIKPGSLLMDRTSILVPLVLRVEHARQRLAALGLTPEALQGR